MSYIPPAPPAPRKSRGKTILLTIIATVGILAVIGHFIDDEVTSPSTSPPVSDIGLSEDTSMEVLRLIWDMELTATERADICEFYNTPPIGTTPEMVSTFAASAEVSYDEADRLLNRLLAEEC